MMLDLECVDGRPSSIVTSSDPVELEKESFHLQWQFEKAMKKLYLLPKVSLSATASNSMRLHAFQLGLVPSKSKRPTKNLADEADIYRCIH